MTHRQYPSGATTYEIPYFVDNRGALNVLEISKELPFECKRIFYTYTVPEGLVRGEHALCRELADNAAKDIPVYSWTEIAGMFDEYFTELTKT